MDREWSFWIPPDTYVQRKVKWSDLLGTYVYFWNLFVRQILARFQLLLLGGLKVIVTQTSAKQVSEPVTWNWTWDYSGLVDNFITSLLKRNYNELVQWLFMLKIPRHSITYRFTARFKPIFQVLFLKVKTHKNDAVLVNFVCGAILLCSGRGRSGNGGAIYRVHSQHSTQAGPLDTYFLMRLLFC